MATFTHPPEMQGPDSEGRWPASTVRWLMDDLYERFKADINHPEHERNVDFRNLEKQVCVQKERVAEAKKQRQAQAAEITTLKNLLDQRGKEYEKKESELCAKAEQARIEERKTWQEEQQSMRAGMNKAYRQVLQLRNNIQLYCKVKPAEKEVPSLKWSYFPSKVTTDVRDYNFHGVWGLQSKNENLYEVLQPILLESRLKQKHTLIVGYGESGSGKSTTLYDATRINDRAVLQHLADDLWNVTEGGNLQCCVRIRCISLEAGGMFDLCANPKQPIDLKIAAGSMNDVPKGATYTKNTYFTYKKKPATHTGRYCEAKTAENRKDFLQICSQALKQVEKSGTANNSNSSRACALIEVRIETGGEARGIITLLDMMGKEDFMDVSSTQKASFQAGHKAAEDLHAILRAIAKHSNRAAQPVKGQYESLKANLTERSRSSNFLQLILPIKDGLVCQTRAAPYVVYIAHIEDTKTKEENNKRTLKRMRGLEATFELGDHEPTNCGRCSILEREIDNLSRPSDPDNSCTAAIAGETCGVYTDAESA